MNPAARNTQSKSGAHPLAYILVASGGGIVGTDYAQWLQLDPFIGAIIGGIISVIMLQIARHLYEDPKGEIKDACTKIGGFIGFVLGAVIGLENSEGFAWIFTALVGGGIGAGMGQMAASILSLAGFAVLFLSQGPVGMAVRAFILNMN